MNATLAPACHGPLSAAFWRGFAVTLRPYLFFVSGSAGLLGLAIAPPLPAAAFTLCTLAFFFSYGLGQALTDVFQTDTDALSAPYRPLASGEIGRAAVLCASLAGLLGCGLALALRTRWNLLLAGAAVAGLLAYSPLKRRFWAGPPCNAAVMALLPAMGLLCGEPSPWRAMGNPLLVPAMASTFWSYAVFVLLGYLKDVEADRTTGYRTVAVRFGRRATVRVSAACALLAVASSAALLARGAAPIGLALAAPAALWLGGVLFLAGAHLSAWSGTRDADAHPAVARSVWAFLALHLGEVSLLRPELFLLSLPLLPLFAAALSRRPCREQI